MYCKKSNKKKKKYDEGILTVNLWQSNRKITLESETGKIEAKMTMYGAGMDNIKEGTWLKVGNFEVEVGAPKAEGDSLLSGM